jgi:UDP:flavonoid glycosyltransferase YjiC (YdhE family)
LRIVFHTFGTLGDLHPMLALSTELRRRGHDCVFAVPEVHRLVLGPLGFPVYPLPPDLDPNDKALIADLMDLRRGSERLLRNVLFPALPQTVAHLRAAVAADGGAQLLVSGDFSYASPIVAELTGIRWASVVLAPISLYSRHDPPALLRFPGLAWLEDQSPAFNRAVLPFARWYTRSWTRDVYQLRRQLGLSRGANPIFDAKNSPQLVLALFSSLLGTPQPDWPHNTVLAGFTFFDGRQPGVAESERALPDHVAEFLQMGEPPIVFTLGSSAVFAAGDFYAISAAAIQKLADLGWPDARAILLTGVLPDGQPRGILSPQLCTAEYVSYAELFPHAAAIVHQGGVGTLAHALKAGKPMLIMPCSHDQPDNARRAERLGVARTIARNKYTADRAAAELHALLRDPATAPGYAAAAKQATAQIEKENGTHTACNALENLLQN